MHMTGYLVSTRSAGKDDKHLAAYLTLRRLALWLDSPMQLLRQMCVLLDATESQQVCARHAPMADGICRMLRSGKHDKCSTLHPLHMRLQERMAAFTFQPGSFLTEPA